MDYFFTFRSITGAQRAMQALARNGLRASLLRSPKALSMKGCGYALKVRPDRAAAAAAAFRQYGVPVQAVYRSDALGRMEAAAL